MAKTLGNALDLLSHFTRERPVWGVRELAKASAAHPAIVQRALATFASRGFLERDPRTQKYALGLRLLELGTQVKERLRLSDLVRPIMDRLAARTGETVFLTLLENREGLCVEVAEGPSSVKYSVRVGTRFPLHAGANAKVVMAYLPEDDLQAICGAGLKRLAKSTVTDPDVLRAQLAAIRAQGWCCSAEEFAEGVFGAAVPLFSRGGGIRGSLGVAVPLFRLEPARPEELVALLRAEQAAVEQALAASTT